MTWVNIDGSRPAEFLFSFLFELVFLVDGRTDVGPQSNKKLRPIFSSFFGGRAIDDYDKEVKNSLISKRSSNRYALVIL